MEAIAQTERGERIRRGLWHDGRVDCIAGNGIMSELGVGVERFDNDDNDAPHEERDQLGEMLVRPDSNDEKVRWEREYRNQQSVGSLPVVVIKNFSLKPSKEEVCGALADWAADLVSGHVRALYGDMHKRLWLPRLHMLLLSATIARTQNNSPKVRRSFTSFTACRDSFM